MQLEEREVLRLSPAQAVPRSYLRLPVEEQDKEKFREALSTLWHGLNPDDREGANKGCVKTFLESTFWDAQHYKVGEVGDIDLAITDKEAGSVLVMFEFKRVGDDGMVRQDDLDRKAMYELVLYYVLEEKANRNSNIRHLIISDGYQYFIFEKGDFWKYFGSDSKFIGKILREENDNHVRREYIYKEIISPKVSQVWRRMTFTYLDLRKYGMQIDDKSFVENRAFNAIYKLFTPTYLLNRPYQDQYDIDNGFYRELLYIMGLQEVAERGRHLIKRMPEGQRACGSLLEQAFTLLDDFFPSPDQTEQRLDAALGLVMVWVNRILFLRLLETQLVNFNGGDRNYNILSRVDSFGKLHALFFNVLAIPENERIKKWAAIFKNVPYLNSSLFELADVEKKYFSVNALSDRLLPVMKGTVLRNRNGHVETGEIHLLDYLLRFLAAYDFGSNQDNEGKTLISAAVLGLIFEKINGYQDGSYFTPGYVTAYMCRKVLRRAVVKKFNDSFDGFHCRTFDDLKEQFDYSNRVNRQKANQLINSIRICDPSVGSGHFLVAALNELLAIKRELNVLCNADGVRMKAYQVRVEGDELAVTDENGEFHYEPDSTESRMVQQTLFEEKRTLIENCLFGVDLNPKSAEICRLRLWIELLKNAYYYKDENGVRHLQTLPNIDINIKRGNSLVMRLPLDADLGMVLKGAGLNIGRYKGEVAEYKKSATKDRKHQMNATIDSVKAKIHRGFTLRSPLYKEWVKAYARLLDKTNNLFSENSQTAEVTRLRNNERKLRMKLDGLNDSRILSHALEWRYEFPEILDDDGKFVGFDIIIGNPPYGVQMDDEYRMRVEAHWKHVPDYEIYFYFLELAHAIVRPSGLVSFIIPNTWLFNVNAETVRKRLLREWDILEVLDCSGIRIFDKATVRNAILTMQGRESSLDESEVENVTVGYRNAKGLREESGENNQKLFNALVSRPLLHVCGKSLVKDFSQNWVLAFRLTEEEKGIVEKIKANSFPLKDVFTEVSQGLIAYDKLKGQSDEVIRSRAYHSHVYKDGYKKWLWGEDVRRYCVKWNGKEYVNYCDGIANPRNPKFFKGKRLLVREITNPSIYATITDEELYHDPAVIVVKDSDAYPLELVCGIMNSKLGTFYHFNNSPKATKGLFPKILITDINNFPLPKLDTDEKKALVARIETLAMRLMDEAAKGNSASAEAWQGEEEVNQLVCQLYGLDEEETNVVNH